MTVNNGQDMGREFGWDDVIEKESDFVVLPKGTYDYQIKLVERGRHEPKPGSTGKLPSCNKAVVHVAVMFNGEEVIFTENLYMYSTMETMLSSFFMSIGQKKEGEPLRMNWNAVPGSTGRCEIEPSEYNGNTYNNVKKWLPKEDKTAPANNGAWTPGSFL